MLFNTWTFAIFLVVLFSLYHGVPAINGKRGIQIALLTIASYFFYAWHTPWLILLLLASTWINASVTVLLLRLDQSSAQRWRAMAFAVLANLAVLAFFKYASLLVSTFFPDSWWSHWGFDFTQIPLPVGISFFTFQGISLVVDVYRNPEVILGKQSTDTLPLSRPISPVGLFCDVAFFKAFFPQLIAGPIVKAREFMHQIGPKTLHDVDWDTAVRQLILGYFFKMVVADNLREATANIAYPSFLEMPGINLLLQLYGFSIQIFADFWGYSLIAMGLAALFGYRLPVNFHFPYLATSITDFWRRWHISLSTWLREYLYIPLGGNRHGGIRTYFNLILVMLLGGLWHGAAWSYMVWGGAHGAILATERLFGVKAGSKSELRVGWLSGIVSALRILLIFSIVTLLWLLFELPNFHEAILYVQTLAAWKGGFSPQPIFTILFFGTPVILYHLWDMARPGIWEPFCASHPESARFVKNSLYAALFALIILNSGTSGAFIYFQF